MAENEKYKPVTTTEIILRQVWYLRKCFEIAREDGVESVEAKNLYEAKDAEAGWKLASNTAIYSDSGELLTFTNDIARKAYLKDQTLNLSKLNNTAKEARDASYAKVEVERSVLSALKSIALNESFEDDLIARFDIMGEGKDGI